MNKEQVIELANKYGISVYFDIDDVEAYSIGKEIHFNKIYQIILKYLIMNYYIF